VVINQIIENLPLCINNGYYQKNHNLINTQNNFDIDIDTDNLTGTLFLKKNLPYNYEIKSITN
jgi:hypothetical protein